MSRHLLVTGGCGFIGSNLIRFLRMTRPNWKITNLDALSYSGNPANLADLEGDPNYRFVHGDIGHAETVEALIGDCDGVLHLAAESHVDRSIMDSRPFVMTNTVGTQTLLDAFRRAGEDGRERRFLYVSTDEVYGSLPLDRPDLKFTEETPLQPNSPYAASKAGGDLLAFAYAHTFNLDILVTRCSNNFGPYQFPEKVIPLFVTNLLEGRKVPLYGDGLNVRDWIHVDDHCEALVTVFEHGQSGRAYNIGGDNERSNLELTRSILDAMGFDEDMIERVPDRLGHDRRYAIDGSRLANELGWRPTRSAWPEALRATIDWYTTRRDWWEPIKRGEFDRYYRAQYQRSSG
ncbi:MAG: dTDP-glucose 4,6-dehydratase [Phycisphaerales bacterium]